MWRKHKNMRRWRQQHSSSLPLLHWFSKHLDKTPNQKLMWFLAWCYKNYPSFFVTKNLQPAFMYQFVQHIVSAVHACLKQKWNYNSTVYEPVLELSDGLQIKYLQNVKGNVKKIRKRTFFYTNFSENCFVISV